MRMLFISEKKLAEIATAVAQARAHPLPWQLLKDWAVPDDKDSLPVAKDYVALHDRPVGMPAALTERPYKVMLPVGYRVSICYEEQPAGLCAHLSVSVETPGALPHPEAVRMILRAFGLSNHLPPTNGRIWVEEFAPGEFAINVVEVTDPIAEPNHAAN